MMNYTRMFGIAEIKVSIITVLKNIKKCFVLGFAFFAFGIILTFGQGIENYYTASSSLYIAGSGDYNKTVSAVQTLTNYTSLIKSQRVAERALSIMGNTTLSYKAIQSMVSYSISGSGIDLTIRAISTDADEAVNIANAVSNAFVEEMRIMTETDTIQILSAANNAVISNNGLIDLWKTRLLFFFAGFAIMAFFIFALELFSDKIRSVDQCFITDEDTILGIIPELDNKK
ncbi:YveK family protein [Butyrivibrio sp. JL13D10]|uniref:YveK family protein n=1 Tax=Butyrivibrio sp. JL13D10 TaxID=3236815 RepID=UPI0038B54874